MFKNILISTISSAIIMCMAGSVLAYNEPHPVETLDPIVFILTKELNNEKAIEDLKVIAETDRISGSERIKLRRIVELFDFVEFLTKRIDRLRGAVGAIKASIVKFDPEDSLLVRTIELIEKESVSDVSFRKMLNSSGDVQRSNMDKLIDLLVKRKEDLVVEAESLKIKKRKLTELDNNLRTTEEGRTVKREKRVKDAMAEEMMNKKDYL